MNTKENKTSKIFSYTVKLLLNNKGSLKMLITVS